MSQQTRLEALAAAIGADVKSLQQFMVDPSGLALTRIEREFATRQDVDQHTVLRRAAVTPAAFTESWANTTAWTGTGSVGSARLFGASGGVLRPAPSTPRWVMRSTYKAPGTAGKFAYMGVQLVDGSVLALGQGTASTSANVNRTGGIPAAAVVLPRALPALPAGDYLVTITKDETCLTLTIQPAVSAGQAVYGTRILLSDLPSAIANVFLSTSAADATTGTWGNVVIYNELQVPPSAVRMGLFTNTQPLVIWRRDSNGNGHYISIPGDNEPQIPTPMVVFCHQSLAASGAGGVAPWAETRWANVLQALNAAGYIVASSDNGPGVTSGGAQDKYGNQAGIDDYVSLIKWVRSHFSTAATMLLGASMGGYFVYNLLHHREIGGIAAAATISGGWDLAFALTDPTYRPLALAAYGAADDADFALKTSNYDPNRIPGYKFRGVPLRLYTGTADTLAPTATAVTPVVNKLGPYAPEVGVVSVAGAAHLADTLYQGSDLVSFFEKYR